MVAAAVVKAGAHDAAPARGQIRAMVVDDSAVIRGFINRTLESDSEIKVVESVSNGELAIRAITRTPVDVVILDIEMPVMDGLTALPRLLRARPGVKVIVASTLTLKNAAISLRALTMGAADYIPKPTAVRELHTTGDFARDLITKVKGLVTPVPQSEEPSGRPSAGLYRGAEVALRAPSRHRPEVVAIGSSTGGPPALIKVFQKLESRLNVAILVTQHMPPTFTTILAEHIERISGTRCAEARDKEPVAPGRIYIAPGDFHMIVEQNGKAPAIRITKDPQENFCRPAVDPMLRSLAATYGPKVLGVILTGMGHDGLDGSRAIVAAGGTMIAQDEPTSVVWGMPGAIATAGLCAANLPIDEIAPRILKLMSAGGQ